MRKLRWLYTLVMPFLLLFSILTSCANNSGNSDTTVIREISVALPQDIDTTLDPHNMSSATTREVLFNIFEGLVKPTTDGSLAPAICREYEISDSGDTFTFTLRDDVFFHNGSPVTVDDVVYSISRCAGLDTGIPLITAFSILDSVSALDDSTVVIKTKVPNIEFLAYLTAAIIPRDYTEQATAPVGTGPFKYASRSPQEYIIFEKFDNYWGNEVRLDRVTFKIIDNNEALMMALRGGTVDLCARLTASQMRELEGGDYNFKIGTMSLVQAVYLNNSVPPFDNAAVRQALSHAINRDEIMDFLSDGLGVPVGSSMYPAFTKYFDQSLVDYYDFDPAKAKQLLSDAGYPNGFDMEITVPSNHQPHIDTATIIVEQLRAIGVNASIKLVEWESWLSDTYRARNYQATLVGVDSSAMTARAMLERFSSSSSSNFINFYNDEYDEVFNSAINATSDELQIELYKRLQAILTEQAANLYIQDLCNVVAVSKTLDGFFFYPLFLLDLSSIQFVS